MYNHMTAPPPRLALFPYTTLFRSLRREIPAIGRHRVRKAHERFLDHREPLSDRGGHRIDALLRRSEEHTSELQSHDDIVCRLLVEKKKYISKSSIAFITMILSDRL